MIMLIIIYYDCYSPPCTQPPRVVQGRLFHGVLQLYSSVYSTFLCCLKEVVPHDVILMCTQPSCVVQDRLFLQ